jgi:hypothetical protein
MKQNTKLLLLAIFTFVLLGGGNVLAGDWLNKKEVTDLLSGNTVRGFYMKQGQSLAVMQKVGIKIKFHADGGAEQTTDRADSSKGLYTEKGKWFVNQKGKLCMTWEVENKKKCGRIKRASDGGYELVRKQQTFVYEEIIPGS